MQTLKIYSFEKGMLFECSIVISTAFSSCTKPFIWVDLQEILYEFCCLRILLHNVIWEVNLTLFNLLKYIKLRFCLEWKLFSNHIKQGTSKCP